MCPILVTQNHPLINRQNWTAALTRERHVVIVGAGMGGLAAAVVLAARGIGVTLLEAAERPGGKMREVEVSGSAIDAGPTVLTMRWAFDELFDDAGASLSASVGLRRIDRIARHAWSDGSRLDLFSDIEHSADAIAQIAGAREAEGYRRFCVRAQAIYETLRDSFIRASRPGPLTLTARVGVARLPDLIRISPFTTMWRALQGYFADPRLRQLFGRYATYCGSSPFLAPATLMLVAHVEREGVWLVDGGMARLAEALCDLARSQGAAFRFGRRVTRIVVENGRAAGVETNEGERIFSEAVIWNGDVSALAEAEVGEEAARAVRATPPGARSMSALTWAMRARVDGFALIRHNVFFSGDYRQEFDDIFERNRLPDAPTVYVCAQDREDADTAPDPSQAERVFCLVNAPVRARGAPLTQPEVESCEQAAFRLLQRCGLRIERDPASTRRTTPEDFARLFPSTRGALYGRATHGWKASFAREGSTTRLPGLYLAGGSVHPGPGAPMAALSGRQAAIRVMRDLASTKRLIPAAMPGGMSTGSATIGDMASR
jgi:1-hydroxycarotenoid 3,4-desaturase